MGIKWMGMKEKREGRKGGRDERGKRSYFGIRRAFCLPRGVQWTEEYD